jgi:thiol-disulfide isomerase/thioredoxin
MKKTFTLLLIILLSQRIISQPGNEKGITDPFCLMIKTIFDHNALSFTAQFNMKKVFEMDTISSYAQVFVKKSGTKISFLQIIPYAGEKELIYCNDSAWVVDHQRFVMDCIGTDTDHMTSNELSAFFSFTLFEIDTLVSRIKPFWEIIDKTEDFTVISLILDSISDDLSDIRVEFTIGNKDHLPYKTLHESTYMNADNIFQEQIFSNYRVLNEEEIKVPDYVNVYEKNLEIVRQEDTIASEITGDKDIYLYELQLFYFSGDPANLPEKGLILLDLWYVGCAPCMKSAPVMERIYEKHKDHVTFIGINETDHDTLKISRFREKMDITFPVLLGKKGSIASKVTGTGGYPLFILLDGGSRKVLWHLTGYTDQLEEIVESEIGKFLQE